MVHNIEKKPRVNNVEKVTKKEKVNMIENSEKSEEEVLCTFMKLNSKESKPLEVKGGVDTS